jgi:lipopolysaccharide/colanic/teichoic acid biosynthesis glycosyltransferase
MTRLLDILFSIAGLVALSPLLPLLMVLAYKSKESILFRQVRVGRLQQPFVLIKLRTMQSDTAMLPSHLVDSSAITSFGRYLRKTKLDELPQLWNVLRGEMSLVGPRPCLFSQEILISERKTRGVYASRPGITGLAQIEGIDMSTPKLLAETDEKMLATLNLSRYFCFFFLTIFGEGSGDSASVKNEH